MGSEMKAEISALEPIAPREPAPERPRNMFQTYLPVLFIFIFSLAVGCFKFVVGHYVGRAPMSEAQAAPYECGNESTGASGIRLDVKFYLTAILFVVFDIEVVFIYPWAALFRQLGWAGFGTMSVFVASLAVALAYAWKKGALEWES
jgi:NADH-quinone oxidoreductase subunit A